MRISIVSKMPLKTFFHSSLYLQVTKCVKHFYSNFPETSKIAVLSSPQPPTRQKAPTFYYPSLPPKHLQERILEVLISVMVGHPSLLLYLTSHFPHYIHLISCIPTQTENPFLFGTRHCADRIG